MCASPWLLARGVRNHAHSSLPALYIVARSPARSSFFLVLPIALDSASFGFSAFSPRLQRLCASALLSALLSLVSALFSSRLCSALASVLALLYSRLDSSRLRSALISVSSRSLVRRARLQLYIDDYGRFQINLILILPANLCRVRVQGEQRVYTDKENIYKILYAQII